MHFGLIQSSSNYLEQLNKYSTYGAMNDDLRKSLRDGDKDLSNNVNTASETCKAVMSSAKGAEMEGDLMDIKMNINKILNDINSSNNPNELGALPKSSSFINPDTTMTYYPKIPYS